MDDARLGLLLVTATALVNIGLSVLVGALASLWSFRRQPSAWSASQAARSSKLCVSAAVWSLVATVFLLWVQTALMSDLPLLEATSALGGVLMQTHLGHAWLFGTLTLLVLLSLASSSERLMTLPFLVAASLCVAVILASKSAASHAGAQSLLLPVVIDWLHLVSINVWSGFVVVATGIVLRGPVPHDLLDRHAYGRYIEALSGAATLALAGVMATGSYSSWRGLAGFVPGAMASTYGVIWLVKMLLVAAAIALGGFNRFVTMPPLLAALRSPRDAFDRSLRTFSVVLRLESVLLLVILGVAAALSTSPPVSNP